VLCARPGGEVVAALGDQPERKVWAEAVDLRQVLAEQRKECRANIELGTVQLTTPIGGRFNCAKYALSCSASSRTRNCVAISNSALSARISARS
jgi:hypothetical protein